MSPTPILYAVFLLASGTMSAFVGIIVWRRRSAFGAGPLLLFLLGSMVWAFTYAMHWLALSQAARDIWLNLTYLGVVSTPAAMLVAALQLNQLHGWLRGRRVSLLIIQPLITTVLLWTDPFHGLFFGGKRDPELSMIYDGGPWFWFNVVYSYSLVLASIVLLLYAATRRGLLYRRQAALVLTGISFPIASNVIGFAGLNPFAGLDLTPIAFNFTGVCLTLGLFRYRLLDLIPVGRDVLMDEIDEGMLLLDSQLRIIDFNPAARKLLDLPAGPLLGQSSEAILTHHPQVISLISTGREINQEMALEGETPLYLQLKVMPIRARAYNPAGILIICHDISERKASEQRLMDANQQLLDHLQQIEDLQDILKELAIRDPLTELYNRRFLQETLPRELARSAREEQPLSLAMLDIDCFKQLNDTHGHQAGDLVLQTLGQLLKTITRRGDIVSRYGGDEFLVVLVNTPIYGACQRADEWRKLFASAGVTYEGHRLRTTISVGVTTFPDHGTAVEQLIRQADIALYQSKANGGDCTCIYSKESESAELWAGLK